jgi:hypothetical protein
MFPIPKYITTYRLTCKPCCCVLYKREIMIGWVKAIINVVFPHTLNSYDPTIFLNMFLCPKNTGIKVITMPRVKLHLHRLKYNIFYMLDQQYGSAIAGWPINRSNVVINIPKQNISSFRHLDLCIKKRKGWFFFSFSLSFL